MSFNKKYRSVQISFNTFDKDLPLVRNAEYLEIDIDLFSDMSRQQFKQHALETADRFWNQMQRSCIHKNSKFKIKREISDDNIGNE